MSDRLNELLQFTEENAKVLRERLGFLSKSKVITYQELINHAKLVRVDVSKISRFVTSQDSWKTIGEDNYKRIIRHLYDHRLWQTQAFCREIHHIGDHLYHSLVDFLNIGIGTEDNVRTRTPGLYKLYRPSILVPSSYIVGYMNIWYDEYSCAMCVTEVQKYTGKDGSRPKRDEYAGYILKKNREYFVIARDKPMRSIHLSMLPSIHYDDSNMVIGMSGVVLGTFNNQVFTARLYLERYDGTVEDLEEYSDIYDKSNIPSSIIADLHEETPPTVKLY